MYDKIVRRFVSMLIGSFSTFGKLNQFSEMFYQNDKFNSEIHGSFKYHSQITGLIWIKF